MRLYLHLLIVGIVTIGICWLQFRALDQVKRRLYFPILILKLLAGVGFVWFYTIHQKGIGDFTHIFSDLKFLYQLDFSSYLKFLFLNDPEGVSAGLAYQNNLRTLFFIKIWSPLVWVSGPYKWLLAVVSATINFSILFNVFSQFTKKYPSKFYPLLIVFFLVPTHVFWTSGITKENLVCIGMCLVCQLFFMDKIGTQNVFRAILVVIGFYFVWKVKYYYAFVWGLFLVFYSLYQFAINQKAGSRPWLAFVLSLVFIGIAYFATRLHPNFYFERVIGVIYDSYLQFHHVSDPDDLLIHYNNWSPTGSSLLLNYPKALISVFFRPFIWEARTIFELIVALERILGLLFLSSYLYFFKKRRPIKLTILDVIWIIYCALMGGLFALTTPNLGTLSRYIVGVTPVFWWILLRSPLARWCFDWVSTKQSIVKLPN